MQQQEMGEFATFLIKEKPVNGLIQKPVNGPIHYDRKLTKKRNPIITGPYLSCTICSDSSHVLLGSHTPFKVYKDTGGNPVLFLVLVHVHWFQWVSSLMVRFKMPC